MPKRRLNQNDLESIPSVGPAIAAKLRLLGYKEPSNLKRADPYDMYKKLYELTGKRHDPCLLDVFISAVSYCNGNSPKPWWEFTAERKAKFNK